MVRKGQIILALSNPNPEIDPDLAILVGVTLITAVFIIVANLVVDVLYAVIDPRVRLA
jgi:peptide/nickel transport system permease protein